MKKKKSMIFFLISMQIKLFKILKYNNICVKNKKSIYVV